MSGRNYVNVSGQAGNELRGVLRTLPHLSDEQLSLVYQVIRREVEQRSEVVGRPRVGWALVRDTL